MMKPFIPFIGGRAGVGLLIFRVVTGIALIIHGLPKIQHPMSWMDKMDAGVHPLLQLCGALGEFGGGLLLALGLLTPLACVGVALVMLTAIFMVHVPQGGGWIGGPNAFEAAASYLLAAVTLFLTGPGAASLDAKLFKRSDLVEDVQVPPPPETVGTRS